MTESNKDGILYYEKQREEIETALSETVARAKACAANTLSNLLVDRKAQSCWQKELNGRAPNKGDFCIFVRENGYMVMALWQYRKLSEKNKTKIAREYDYKAIPEDRVCQKSS